MIELRPPPHFNRDLSNRGSTPGPDPSRPFSQRTEVEADGTGGLDTVALVFLVNRQCPWRCVMCDLWQYTTRERTPPGAIPSQIEQALRQLPTANTIKLYNAGSFFDVGAIPPADYPAIARLLAPFQRVIVECHPRLVGDRCLQFRDLIPGRLEIALGLETAHEQTLASLDKRFTLSDYSTATAFLSQHGIDCRVFLLVHPPFMPPEQAERWLERSIDFAMDQGARVISLIPLRRGTPILRGLAEAGQLSPPSLSQLEDGLSYGLARRRALVMVDPWDLDQLEGCTACSLVRRERLCAMNHQQVLIPHIMCDVCGQPRARGHAEGKEPLATSPT